MSDSRPRPDPAPGWAQAGSRVEPGGPTAAGLAGLRVRVPVEVTAALDRAVSLGFLGPMGLEDQIDHALGFVLTVEQDRPAGVDHILDLGSGGGLPGLVLAASWPGAQLTLLDSGRRRTEFLAREATRLPGGRRIRVVRGRAEELGHDGRFRERFDLVTARSFGPPAVTAECGAPFVAPGGLLVVSESPASDDSRWDDQGLAELGLSRGPAVRVEDRFGYRFLHKASVTARHYPRRTGLPAKRPLF